MLSDQVLQESPNAFFGHLWDIAAGKCKGFPSLGTDKESGKESPFWFHHLAEQEVLLLFHNAECDTCPCSHTFFFFFLVLIDTLT